MNPASQRQPALVARILRESSPAHPRPSLTWQQANEIISKRKARAQKKREELKMGPSRPTIMMTSMTSRPYRSFSEKLPAVDLNHIDSNIIHPKLIARAFIKLTYELRSQGKTSADIQREIEERFANSQILETNKFTIGEQILLHIRKNKELTRFFRERLESLFNYFSMIPAQLPSKKSCHDDIDASVLAEASFEYPPIKLDDALQEKVNTGKIAIGVLATALLEQIHSLRKCGKTPASIRNAIDAYFSGLTKFRDCKDMVWHFLDIDIAADPVLAPFFRSEQPYLPSYTRNTLAQPSTSNPKKQHATLSKNLHSYGPPGMIRDKPDETYSMNQQHAPVSEESLLASSSSPLADDAMPCSSSDPRPSTRRQATSTPNLPSTSGLFAPSARNLDFSDTRHTSFQSPEPSSSYAYTPSHTWRKIRTSVPPQSIKPSFFAAAGADIETSAQLKVRQDQYHLLKAHERIPFLLSLTPDIRHALIPQLILHPVERDMLNQYQLKISLFSSQHPELSREDAETAYREITRLQSTDPSLSRQDAEELYMAIQLSKGSDHVPGK